MRIPVLTSPSRVFRPLLQKDGSSLPAAARDNLAKAYKDLLAVITAKDKPAMDKGKEVIVYVQVRSLSRRAGASSFTFTPC